MMYPEKDAQYEEVKIATVITNSMTGWDIRRSDGWNFFVPLDSPVVPVVGMTARFYGRGIGSTVRGLFLDGTCVYYRTKEEDTIYQNNRAYGKDAAEWLARWDRGESVWSVEMGGMGPGYEQAIQITVAEILRHLLVTGYDHAAWSDTEKWKADRNKIETACFENTIVKLFGLSGAQWGAAMQVATRLYMHGPVTMMTDPELPDDRKIQVSRTFPTA